MQRPEVLTRLMVDFKANPKKVVVLALLFAVAAYFWAPLFGKLFTKSHPEIVQKPRYSLAELGANLIPPQEEQQSWRDLTQAIEEDPNTKPSPEIDWARNPFEMPIETPEVEPELELAPVEETVPSEEQHGAQAQLLLKGTLVSANKKTALINNDSYQEGETIDFGEGFAVRIDQVASRYVVLEAGGVRVELELNTPTTITESQFRRLQQ